METLAPTGGPRPRPARLTWIALPLAAVLASAAWASGRPGARKVLVPCQSPRSGAAARARLRQAVQAKHPASGLEVSGAEGLFNLDSVQDRIAAARRKPPPVPRLHLGRKLGPGAQLPGENLRKVVWQGVDLRDANLRGADLRGAWLVDAKLDGADLTGAWLDDAVLDGASLAGAKLFDSSTVGTAGLDSSGALSHPFFAPDPAEAVGQIRYLRLGTGADREVFAPRCPTPSADGRLYWIGGPQEELHAIFRHGARFTMPHLPIQSGGPRNNLLYTLIRDAQGALWFFGDQVVGNIQVQEQKTVRGDRELAVNRLACTLPEAPASATPAPDQGVDLTFSHFTASCDWKAGTGSIAVVPAPEGAVFLSSCRNHPGTLEVTALEGAEGLRASRSGGKAAWPVPLPAGTILQTMAAGPKDSIWVALSGADALLTLGGQPGQERLIRLPAPEAGTPVRGDLPGLFGLALGPDGNLWFTRPSCRRIGRCTPDGEILEFRLDDDEFPLEITAADDGTLLFTLLGRNRIGSIRAAARPTGAAAAPAPGDGKASVPGEASAAPAEATSQTESKAKPSKRQRLKRREQRIGQDATLASLARDPESAPGSRSAARTGAPVDRLQAEGAGPATAGAAPKPSAPEPERKQTAAWDPADELYDRGVTLPEASARHILDTHFGSGQDGKSVFRAEHAGLEGLETLLARGLAAAGGPGQVFDRDGRRYTYCRMDADVGHVWTGRHWEAVNRFVIVTVDRWNRAEGFTEHVVLSAYPCSRNY